MKYNNYRTSEVLGEFIFKYRRFHFAKDIYLNKGKIMIKADSTLLPATTIIKINKIGYEEIGLFLFQGNILVE